MIFTLISRKKYYYRSTRVLWSGAHLERGEVAVDPLATYLSLVSKTVIKLTNITNLTVFAISFIYVQI